MALYAILCFNSVYNVDPIRQSSYHGRAIRILRIRWQSTFTQVWHRYKSLVISCRCYFIFEVEWHLKTGAVSIHHEWDLHHRRNGISQVKSSAPHSTGIFWSVNSQRYERNLEIMTTLFLAISRPIEPSTQNNCLRESFFIRDCIYSTTICNAISGARPFRGNFPFALMLITPKKCQKVG